METLFGKIRFTYHKNFSMPGILVPGFLFYMYGYIDIVVGQVK